MLSKRFSTIIFSFSIIVTTLILSTFPYFNTNILVYDIFAATEPSIFSNENNVINCISQTCNGTEDDDIVIGSSLSEEIYGLDGNDKIQGNAGNDTIYGGKGDDIISGGSGFDKLYGQDGNDVLIGDSTTSVAEIYIGNDQVAVDTLNEYLLGENNGISLSNMMNTYNNKTDISSNIENNTINVFSSDIQLLDGGKGDDYLLGQSSNEYFIGGPGHDYFDCNEGIDRILDFDKNEDTANINCEFLD